MSQVKRDRMKIARKLAAKYLPPSSERQALSCDVRCLLIDEFREGKEAAAGVLKEEIETLKRLADERDVFEQGFSPIAAKFRNEANELQKLVDRMLLVK